MWLVNENDKNENEIKKKKKGNKKVFYYIARQAFVL